MTRKAVRCCGIKAACGLQVGVPPGEAVVASGHDRFQVEPKILERLPEPDGDQVEIGGSCTRTLSPAASGRKSNGRTRPDDGRTQPGRSATPNRCRPHCRERPLRSASCPFELPSARRAYLTSTNGRSATTYARIPASFFPRRAASTKAPDRDTVSRRARPT